ncbi:MAG: NF038122 family metalloprotease [Blastocatellia bacterium]
MRSAPTRAAAASLLVLNLAVLPSSQRFGFSIASVLPQGSAKRNVWLAPNNLGTFVRKMVDGRAVCVEATTEQAQSIKDRDPDQLAALAAESDPSRSNQTGLRILLRGTTQLQGFPTALEAFKRAAARWETLIQSRITVVIDVDFGPSLFGKPFGENVVSSSDAQVLRGNALYPAVRARLISGALAPEEISLYNALPAKIVPTDGGQSACSTATSATLRALDLINPIADLNGELAVFGPPPAIAVNSKFSFDFDSDDGVAQDKLDFEAIALHEIGHILGFVSFVGQKEMDSSLEVAPSTWDLFRVRSGSSNGEFATVPRIVSTGGDQSFYAGEAAVALSTGRPDGAGGDGRQASHWKDDNLTAQYIGVMDPTIAPGERHFITGKDVAVLDAIGFRAMNLAQPLVPLASGQPQIGGMVAPPPNVGVVSHTQYTIQVPAGASQLTIDLNGNQDIDLFARFGQRVFINGFRLESDYFSATESGSESITITPASSRPLRQGTYYIAVANFGPGDTDFVITATVTGGITNHPPAIFNVSSLLQGDVLDLSYAALDLEGDITRTDVTILDEAGRALSQSSSVVTFPGGSAQIESGLSIGGMNSVPGAVRASIVLTDRGGNVSAEAIVRFGDGDSGGLTLVSASFDETRLTLRTSGLAESLEVEINGHVVAPPRAIKLKGSGKLIVKGDAGQLALKRGANRIRVKNARGWSNILVLTI